MPQVESYAILVTTEMVYDFHTHTSISDGVLSPLELVRRALINGYKAIGITDHAGIGYLERLIKEITADCVLAEKHWNIAAIPGVELTHVPAAAIAQAARKAKERGGRLVVVQGETIAEPVEPGTNMAALKSPHVDILAHPGMITIEEAKVAAAGGIYLEITARKQHSPPNKHVAEMARRAGAKLIVDSDAHDELDLLTSESAFNIARNANLTEAEIVEALQTNPQALLRKLLSQ